MRDRQRLFGTGPRSVQMSPNTWHFTTSQSLHHCMSVDLDEGSLVDQVSWNLAEVRVRLGRSSEEGQRVITVNMSLCTALMSLPSQTEAHDAEKVEAPTEDVSAWHSPPRQPTIMIGEQERELGWREGGAMLIQLFCLSSPSQPSPGSLAPNTCSEPTDLPQPRSTQDLARTQSYLPK